MNEFLEREPLDVGLIIQPSIWHKIEDYYDEDPNKAFAFLLLYGRYHFYGAEPSEFADIFPRDVIRDVNGERALIEGHIVKYQKAVEGGKRSKKITDEDFIEMIESGRYSTQGEIAEEIGITKQAVSQRMKKLGIDWKSIRKVSKGFETETETPTFETENPLSPLLARIKQAH